MKLFKTSYREDFGHEWYVQIFNTSRHYPRRLRGVSLIQLSFSYDDEPTWYFQLSSSSYGPLSMMITIFRFSFVVDLFTRTWNWDYAKDIDNQCNYDD